MPRTVDGWAKVSGAARFAADAVPSGHLVGAVITTRWPGVAVRVDTDALRLQPGVTAALGPDDDPGVEFSSNPHGGTRDRVVFPRVGRFVGDVVGAVAATDRDALERALRLTGVLVEDRRAGTAGGRGSPTAHLANDRYPGDLISTVSVGSSEDDVAGALAESPRRHRTRVALGAAPHGYLERIAAAASWEDAKLVVWSSTQCPMLVRGLLAEIFMLRDEDVVMEPVYVGGGFGAKEELSLEPVAACLSRASGGAPVLVELTRDQCTRAYGSRHGGTVSVETGFDDDGTFRARWIEVDLEAGPYDGHSTNVVRNALASAMRLYPRGAVGGRGIAHATHRTPGVAYRGYGATQAAFACETHVDEIATLLDMDVLEIRRRNVARPADLDPTSGAPLDRVRGLDCLDVLGANLRPCVGTRDGNGRYRSGVGLALLVCTSSVAEPGALDRAEVLCRFDGTSGEIVVETPVVEAGQGIFSALREVVARTLGVPSARVDVASSTRAGLYDPGMFGSRGAHVTCTAASIAAEELRAAVTEQAAALLDVAPAAVGLDEQWRAARVEDREVLLSALGVVERIGTFTTSDVALAFGAQAVELTVDVLTGSVVVDRIVSVHDAGVVLDPDVARAQIEGGVIHGLGAALSERLTFGPDGSGLESGLLSHLIPTLAGLPVVDVVFLGSETAGARGSGAKGIGEAPMMGIPSAVANAISDATGRRLDGYPMVPERVLKALTPLV